MLPKNPALVTLLTGVYPRDKITQASSRVRQSEAAELLPTKAPFLSCPGASTLQPGKRIPHAYLSHMQTTSL